MGKTWSLVLSLGFFAASAVPTHADFFFFNDRGKFQEFATGVRTIDFEGLTPPGQSSQGMSSLTVNGVHFQALLGQLFTTDSAYAPLFYDWGSGASLVGNGCPNEFRVDLPAGTTAAGLDVMTFGPYAQPVTMALSNGQSLRV